METRYVKIPERIFRYTRECYTHEGFLNRIDF